MVQSAKSPHRYDFIILAGTFHGLTTSKSFLGQRKMCSIIMVVTDVLVHQSPQMAFIQHDHMVEQISTAASDPALSDAILFTDFLFDAQYRLVLEQLMSPVHIKRNVVA
jgi:hypothetical protein